MKKIIQSGLEAYKQLLAISILLALVTVSADISQIYGNLLSALSIIVGFFVNVILLMHNFISTVNSSTSDNYYRSIKETYERTAALIILGSIGIFLIVFINIVQAPKSPLIFDLLSKLNVANPIEQVFSVFGSFVYVLPNFIIVSISYSFFLILVDIIIRIVKMYHFEMQSRS